MCMKIALGKQKNTCVSATILEKNIVDRWARLFFNCYPGYTVQGFDFNTVCPKMAMTTLGGH